MQLMHAPSFNIKNKEAQSCVILARQQRGEGSAGSMQSGKRPFVRDNGFVFPPLIGNHRHLLIAKARALWFVVFPMYPCGVKV